MIRIVLVDDHGVMRDGLRAILQSQPDMTVVGEAGDGVEAIQAIVRHKPDVVLLDLSLPLLSGLDVLCEMRARRLATAALVLSMHDSGDSVRTALAQGARGYLPKGTAAPEVVRAVRAVHAGRRYLPQSLAGRAIEALLEPGAGARPIDALSHRERQVLRLVCEGKTSQEIGVLLHVSSKTVDTYRVRLMRKLGVGDVASLVRLAIREGVISAD